MQHEILGQFAQFAKLTLAQDEFCWAGKGGIMSYSDGVEWRLRVPGGVAGAARRMLSGEGLALAHLRATRNGATASLASSQAGRILILNLEDGPVLTTRGSFLAAWGDVDLDVTVAKRAGAALFGGAGLFLQRISGRGTVLVHCAGDVDDRRLAAGESLHVSTGHLAAFTDAVDYDIRYVGNVRKALFSGEGLFMTRLTGPGRVLLQTLKRRQEIAVRQK
ncbi:MAG: TIGR00266 family protein [Gammaproteobacteria bacterium]|nr:TIGR00266 family protein [Gammaproteobacteria bacterium]